MSTNFFTSPDPLTYQFFVFVWPGQVDQGMEIERALLTQGEEVIVIASGVPKGPSHWVHLSNEAYFGAQFATCLEMADRDILVHVQADAQVADFPELIRRMKLAFDREDIGIWAPDVDYTFYKTEFVRAPDTIFVDPENPLPGYLVPVLNTDCTCWALRSTIVSQLRAYQRPNWNLGWGWDSLAAACAWISGSLVVRDVEIVVAHPKGTGYDATQANTEFASVKKDLPPAMKAYVAVAEELILSRYSRSSHWVRDRLRSRIPLMK